jgi:hypothetical protein
MRAPLASLFIIQGEGQLQISIHQWNTQALQLSTESVNN